MPYDNDNIFAKLLRGEILTKKIYEDEYALAFPDINPQAPVHILLIPKGKYVSASDFGANASPQEIAGYYRALSVVVKMMQIEETFKKQRKQIESLIQKFNVHKRHELVIAELDKEN